MQQDVGIAIENFILWLGVGQQWVILNFLVAYSPYFVFTIRFYIQLHNEECCLYELKVVEWQIGTRNIVGVQCVLYRYEKCHFSSLFRKRPMNWK